MHHCTNKIKSINIYLINWNLPGQTIGKNITVSFFNKSNVKKWKSPINHKILNIFYFLTYQTLGKYNHLKVQMFQFVVNWTASSVFSLASLDGKIKALSQDTRMETCLKMLHGPEYGDLAKVNCNFQLLLVKEKNRTN